MRAQLLSLAFAAAALVGCSSGEHLAAAERKAAAFHRSLDAGRFEEIYADAAPEFRAATSMQKFARLLTAVRTGLGPVKSAGRQGFNVNYGTAGTVTTLVYSTEFAKGAAVETFAYSHAGNAPRLLAYNINSDALIGS